jgi:hypothetical protein
MSHFDEQNLFSSGPHRFHVGGLSLRHVLQPTMGTRSVAIAALGQSGRAIAQEGDLLADDPAALHALAGAIEECLDGRSAELVDDLDQSWPDTVMLAFEPAPPRRVGARWALAYRIQYLQLTG